MTYPTDEYHTHPPRELDTSTYDPLGLDRRSDQRFELVKIAFDHAFDIWSRHSIHPPDSKVIGERTVEFVDAVLAAMEKKPEPESDDKTS